MQAVAKLATYVVGATVDQVLPKLGLAYIRADDEREFALTRSTPGDGFSRLSPGDRVLLQIERFDRFAVVREFKWP